MTISFKSLGLSDARVEHLENLGFVTPTNIQAQAIPHLLEGRDIVGQSQTGTGKTAAYSLPLLEKVAVRQHKRTSNFQRIPHSDKQKNKEDSRQVTASHVDAPNALDVQL